MERLQSSSAVFARASLSQAHPTTISDVKEPFLKRPFDACLAGLGLLVSAPLWGLIALSIKLEDGGSVFFRQERWGRGKRVMRVYKFRTMSPNADRTMQATADDPSITRVGHLLWATALDEMPQLLNSSRGR